MGARSALAAGLLLGVAAAAYFGLQWRDAESRATKATEWGSFLADSLGSAMSFPPPPVGPEGPDSVYWQWVATTATLQARRWQKVVRVAAENRATLLEVHEIEDLRRQGLDDPVAELRSSLMAHPELIPCEPVLGGTMGFYSPEGIVLLAPPWAFAHFSDGHVSGVMLLRYALLEDRSIRWIPVWSECDS
jgi:hypothetical protein